MYYSPLRYPGGKSKLAPFMGFIIDRMNLVGGTYVEPFAGGAAIALELLFTNKVSHIVINDYDKSLASFWRAATREPDRLIEKMYNTPVTIEEWEKQRSVLMNSTAMSFDLGFATFYLNRTNRSGILKAGPIGGKNQAGEWKLDARFNKKDLEKRIAMIGEHRKEISVYNQDANCFIKKYLPRYGQNTLVYFDPPYCEKGSELYLNYFNYKDHETIEKTIREHVNCNWIITYDDVKKIHRIYDGYEVRRFDLTYSLANKRHANELMIFSDESICPTNRELSDCHISMQFV